MAARRTKKTTTQKRATKKASTRRTAKKKTAKKASRKKNGAPPKPVEKAIRGEARYKLKAAHLEWQAEENRVIAEAQDELQKLLNRKRRNDTAWRRTNKARLAAFNEVIDAQTPNLPEGFAIKHVDAVEGNFRAEYDPDNRGQHVA